MLRLSSVFVVSSFLVAALSGCLITTIAEGEGEAEDCVLDVEFREVVRQRELVLLSDSLFFAVVELDVATGEQLVASLANEGTVVADVDAAFSQLSGPLQVQRFWDLTNEAAIDVLSYRHNDGSHGAFFVAGTTQIVATVFDGDVSGCTLERGPVGDCAITADCDVGYACQGSTDDLRGRCIPNDVVDDGSVCVASSQCTEGQRCDGTGTCRPAFMTGTFSAEGFPASARPIAAGDVVTVLVDVSGLATVDTDVSLNTFIFHPDVSTLTISLRNPGGTVVPLFVDVSGDTISFNGRVTGFSGDEGVNGTWALIIDNADSTFAGEIREFVLTVGSRLD